MQTVETSSARGTTSAGDASAADRDSRAASRREFLRILGVVSAVGATGAHSARGGLPGGPVHESWGMLTDLTLCIGCRKCEFACKQTNGFAHQPIEAFEDKSVFERRRRIGAEDVTFVNRHGAEPAPQAPEEASKTSPPAGRAADRDRAVYVKSQCMHCNEPACVSACPVAAIRKTAQGPVVYAARKCIGCRYCMMACPFSMLAYTYDDPFTPVIRKCSMCYEHVSRNGGVPSCVKICPVEAITFGKRGELLALAREKIRNHPERYVDHIYGEHEVGGTSVLYLGPRPFGELGFRTDLGTRPLPELTSRFMSMVPLVISIWPAVLAGAYQFTKRRAHHLPEGPRPAVRGHARGDEPAKGV